MKKILLCMVLICVMFFTFGLSSEAYTLVNLKKGDGKTNVTYRGSSTVVQIPDAYELKVPEFRAAWVFFSQFLILKLIVQKQLGKQK